MVPNTVFATRGCRSSCDFCSVPAAGFGWHTRPVADVIGEIPPPPGAEVRVQRRQPERGPGLRARAVHRADSPEEVMGRPGHDEDCRRRGTAGHHGRQRVPVPVAGVSNRSGRGTSTGWANGSIGRRATCASPTRCTGGASSSRAASSSAWTRTRRTSFRDGGGRERPAHRHPQIRALHAVPGHARVRTAERGRGVCCTSTGNTTTRSTSSSGRGR